MRFPKWTAPIMLRLLSLAGLTSAGGDKALIMVGFALSTAAFPTQTLSQPTLSLELDFFIKAAEHEFKVPIMPLHLLGKKSWNVYNHDNIEKVKRDEAIAKAKEEAEEQRMQELDAERQIQILRGEIPTPLPIEDTPKREKLRRDEGSYGSSGRERKRRKKAGENDTDFEMRVAHEQTSSSNTERQITLWKDSNAPITDHAGHISLFPQVVSREPAVEKNAEAEKELAKKKKEYEDQYTMKFSNAAGFKQSLDKPWYSKPDKGRAAVEDVEDVTGKDVWGNEDPRRKEREKKRVVDNDPLAMMKQGAAGVRQVERERKRWREEKEREIRELEDVERRRKKHKRRHDDEEDDLETFRLDGEERSSSGRGHDRDKERRHRQKYSRSEHRDDSRRDSHRHRRHHRD